MDGITSLNRVKKENWSYTKFGWGSGGGCGRHTYVVRVISSEKGGGWVGGNLLKSSEKGKNGVTHKIVGIVERAMAGRLMWWGSYLVKKWGGWVGIVCGG